METIPATVPGVLQTAEGADPAGEIQTTDLPAHEEDEPNQDHLEACTL